MSGAQEWSPARALGRQGDCSDRPAQTDEAVDIDRTDDGLLGDDGWSDADDVDHRSTPLRAVSRVCDLIDALAQHPDGVTLSALSAEVRLPKSSAFRYLAALEIREYVERTPDGVGYRLGPRNFGRPTGALRVDRLLMLARPLMERLLDNQMSACLLGGLDGSTVRFYWSYATSPPDPRIPRPGDREALHTTAIGKAIAAQLADETVTALLVAGGMRPATPASVPTAPLFLRELHHIRGEGYSVTTNERYPDVRGIAVPVGGEPLAISLVGLTARIPDEAVLPAVRRLRRASAVLARGLR